MVSAARWGRDEEDWVLPHQGFHIVQAVFTYVQLGIKKWNGFKNRFSSFFRSRRTTYEYRPQREKKATITCRFINKCDELKLENPKIEIHSSWAMGGPGEESYACILRVLIRSSRAPVTRRRMFVYEHTSSYISYPPRINQRGRRKRRRPKKKATATRSKILLLLLYYSYILLSVSHWAVLVAML